MPRYICKANVDGTDYYLEWSSVVDAPVTSGMTLDEFRAYYRERYGSEETEPFQADGLSSLGRRMVRVEAFGTSSMDGTSFEELTRFNRAGENEECLTHEQILEQFIRTARSNE